MIFGEVSVDQSLGAVVAHAVRQDGLTLKKGHVIRAADIEALRNAGIARLIVSRLEEGDVSEDDAAARLANHVVGSGLRADRPFTGRANLFAMHNGVLRIDTAAVDRINAVDEAVTLATLPAFRSVVAGEMAATVKIIPFAVAGSLLAQAMAAAASPVIAVEPYRPMRLGVLSTVLPGLKPSVINKTIAILSTRLCATQSAIVAEEKLAHTTPALADAIARFVPQCDLIIIFGASAITDRRDVIPSAIEQAGGTIEHFGMPVDPGNLLLLGHVQGKTIIGAPGCARSPKENGFDWVLQRLLAGIPVTAADIRQMGVGGLLMEIVSRPQPRLASGMPVSPEAQRQPADGLVDGKV
jgi:molybdenum cofactor cytidylyltransferase